MLGRKTRLVGPVALALILAIVVLAPAAGVASGNFKPGIYRGKTKQRQPLSFGTSQTKIGFITVLWKARCSDGKLHPGSSSFGSTLYPIHRGRFRATATFTDGAQATFRGRLIGKRAHGTFARSGPTNLGFSCSTGKVRWNGHHTNH